MTSRSWGRGQGLCDDSTKFLGIKAVTMGGGGSKIAWRHLWTTPKTHLKMRQRSPISNSQLFFGQSDIREKFPFNLNLRSTSRRVSEKSFLGLKSIRFSTKITKSFFQRSEKFWPLCWQSRKAVNSARRRLRWQHKSSMFSKVNVLHFKKTDFVTVK